MKKIVQFASLALLSGMLVAKGAPAEEYKTESFIPAQTTTTKVFDAKVTEAQQPLQSIKNESINKGVIIQDPAALGSGASEPSNQAVPAQGPTVCPLVDPVAQGELNLQGFTMREGHIQLYRDGMNNGLAREIRQVHARSTRRLDDGAIVAWETVMRDEEGCSFVFQQSNQAEALILAETLYDAVWNPHKSISVDLEHCNHNFNECRVVLRLGSFLNR